MIRDYFVNIFDSVGPEEDDNLLDALEQKVTSEINEALLKPYTAEEVQTSIKQMHPA